MGGLAVSCAAMAFTCYLSVLAGDYILNAMARADALTILLEAQKNGNTVADNEASLLLLPSSSSSSSTEKPAQRPDTKFAVEFDKTNEGRQSSDEDGVLDENYLEKVKQHGRLLVSNRKFELTELVCMSRLDIVAMTFCSRR